MKSLQALLRLVALPGIVAISAACGRSFPQTSALASILPETGQFLPSLPHEEVPTKTTSLRLAEQVKLRSEARLIVIPLNQPSILAVGWVGPVIGVLGTTVVILVVAGVVIWQGLVVIGENEVGIVYKKFAPLRGSSSGGHIAQNKEAGYQPNPLRPGSHFGYWPWIYSIRKEPVIYVSPEEVGLVIAKDGKPLSTGQLFGEAVECKDFEDAEAFLIKGGQKGRQLKILATGKYWINTELFEIRREPLVKIRSGEIALVLANYGEPLESGQILGRVVECNDFQNGEAFIRNKGQRGRQLAILTEGEYQINTDLFTIITSKNIAQHGLNANELNHLKVHKINPGSLGVVTTEVGRAVQGDEIAGLVIQGHNNFQNPQAFIDSGGYKGLQEDFLRPGEYSLNPWFVKVEQIQLTEVPDGTVGVIISSVGKPPVNPHELVEEGYRGVQKRTLPVGLHSINTEVKRIVIVPIHEISLYWSDELKDSKNYDASLKSLKLRSKDHYEPEVEVKQIIQIPPESAPKMISRVGVYEESDQAIVLNADGTPKYGSIKGFVTRVLESIVDKSLRDSAKDYNALDFHESRIQQHGEAADHIKIELEKYGVQSVGTYITKVSQPPELARMMNARTLAIQQIDTYAIQTRAAQSLQELNYQEALADIQRDLARYSQGVRIAELEAMAQQYRIKAAADSTRQQGLAQAGIVQAIVDVIGRDGYLDVEKLKQIVNLRLPDVWVSGSDGSSGSIQALIASILRPGSQQNLPNQLTDLVQPDLLQTQPTPPYLKEAPETVELRCPIVLLLDTSGSMSSECMAQLVEGITTFRREILGDTMASRRVEVTIIGFGSFAQVIQDFTTVDRVSPLQLTASGVTAIGQGIELALNGIEQRLTTYKSSGIQHYSPWLLLITGGTPADNWQGAARHINKAIADYKLNFFAVGVQGVDLDTLVQITPPNIPPVMLDGLKFQELFYWLADSMKRISNSAIGSGIDLSPIATWAKIDKP